MNGKKFPGRFTIGFNLADPNHREVAELLEQQGRRKAQFLVNAVLFYTNCPNAPEPAQQAGATADRLEKLVVRVLEDRGYLEKGQHKERASLDGDSHTGGEAMLPGSPLDGASIAAIAGTLAAFRE